MNIINFLVLLCVFCLFSLLDKLSSMFLVLVPLLILRMAIHLVCAIIIPLKSSDTFGQTNKSLTWFNWKPVAEGGSSLTAVGQLINDLLGSN